MEIQKFILDDFEDDEITIGLLRLAKQVPDFELFFKINAINNFCFSRIEDLKIVGEYYDYFFSVFEGYSVNSKSCFRFISNKSWKSIQKKEVTELFSNEHNIKLLLENNADIDYIIKSSDKFADFSLILLPENLTFSLQEITISSDTELYQTIQYYE